MALTIHGVKFVEGRELTEKCLVDPVVVIYKDQYSGTTRLQERHNINDTVVHKF